MAYILLPSTSLCARFVRISPPKVVVTRPCKYLLFVEDMFLQFALSPGAAINGAPREKLDSRVEPPLALTQPSICQAINLGAPYLRV